MWTPVTNLPFILFNKKIPSVSCRQALFLPAYRGGIFIFNGPERVIVSMTPDSSEQVKR